MIDRFIELLKSVDRDNTIQLLTDLKRLGFFEAPASANHHLNVPEGLIEHSLAVCDYALKLRDAIPEWNDIDKDSVIVCSLLHDVCKSDLYVPITKRQRQQDGTWVDVNGYGCDYSPFPMGHGEKSVIIILRNNYPLTNEEMLAIRWHMYAFDVNFNNRDLFNSFNEANKIPLVKLIQVADQIASSLNK